MLELARKQMEDEWWARATAESSSAENNHETKNKVLDKVNDDVRG